MEKAFYKATEDNINIQNARDLGSLERRTAFAGSGAATATGNIDLRILTFF